eukprot:NODE_12731_length_443_cov_1.560127_g12708_i0.p2 GENE.NODE_12731_length_443_cov_1.560127_g12708_i0~~NODE_12731_length_443_cov_1.560127_g12708_i0.p2  ORF type:complete len:125 (-),score=21.43 NODE_12731_length_443_cov_1.560127_g12708_i0:69-443(-)
MKKELKPIQVMANALWPGSDEDVVKITSRVQRSQGAERDHGSVVNMYVGAEGGRTGTPHAHLVEWGTGPRTQQNGRYTGQMPPQPFLQPAWDANKAGLLQGLGSRLWEEIAKTQARRAKKAAKG